MFDDLGALFMNSVIAAHDEYVIKRDERKSGRDQHLRAAIGLATALFHIREHLPAQLAKSRRDIEAACPDYRLIADVANATKHAQVERRTPQGTSLIASADDVQEVVAITLFEDAQGIYSDFQTLIMAKCSDGTKRNLDLALTNALNFWSGFLSQAGIVTYPQVPVPLTPGVRFIQRKDTKSVEFDVLNTIRFRSNMQILKFDATKGYAEPMDLKDAQIVMRVFKPRPIIVDITVSIPQQGEVTVPIELSDAQTINFYRLKMETDKQAFMKAIFEERANEIIQKAAIAFQEKAEATRSPDMTA
jgi:hypothetical protein